MPMMSQMEWNRTEGRVLDDAGWQPAQRFVPLVEDVIQVWRTWAVGEGPFHAACLALLAPGEQARMLRMRAGVARDEFVIGRGCLRALAGKALGRAPGEVVFFTGSNGKPWVEGLEFNVSHSNGMILLGLSRHVVMGLDVEAMKPGIEALEIAEEHFSPGECARVAGVPEGPERERLFYRCWVRKEAVVKAHGQGITLALNGFDVNLDAGDETPVWITGADAGGGQAIFVRELPVGPGFAGALAMNRSGSRVQLLELMPELLRSD